MRSVVILVSGLADTPAADLGGKTPLEAAETPALDELAAGGILGLTRSLPEGGPPLRSMATAAMLGVNGAAHALLPGPAAAAGMDLAVSPAAHAACLDLVAIGEQEGVGLGVVGSHLLPIEPRDAAALAASLGEALGDLGIRVFPAVGCRHVALLEAESPLVLRCPPEDAIGRPLGEVLPEGAAGETVRLLMSRARAMLWEHPACSGMRAQGGMSPTDVWLWGGGAPASLPTLRTRFGVRATAVAVDPLARGAARLMGLTVTPTLGDGALLPDLASRARQAAALAAEHELVFLHVETPEAFAHRGDAAGKAQAISRIDAEVVGPIAAALRELDPDWRLMVASDVVVSSTTRRHTSDPVPFVVASSRGGGRRGPGKRRFGEREAREEGIFVAEAHTLLERLLRR